MGGRGANYKFFLKYNSINNVHIIGKLTKQEISAIENEFGELSNDNIVLTDERVNHIKRSRKMEFKRVISRVVETVRDYDFFGREINDRSNNQNSIIFIKKIEEDGLYSHVVISLNLKKFDDPGKENSVISSRFMSEKKVNKYLNKMRIIDIKR